ncbi:hypothetical protein FOZ61_010880 [Perkinsus olseni]|uniref:Uncharacterized protein n=1 Tax=Perkinsus olseni TaxID=32597 RepID=A0A7J6M1M6_PEROL|nr:hypothetical protein FOZ61_010880 [Perkinsus olseni]
MSFYYVHQTDRNGEADDSYHFTGADQRMAMAFCGVLTLIFMFIACVAFYKGLSREYSREGEKSRNSPENLSAVLAEQTEVVEHSLADDDQDCSICLGVVRFLPNRKLPMSAMPGGAGGSSRTSLNVVVDIRLLMSVLRLITSIIIHFAPLIYGNQKCRPAVLPSKPRSSSRPQVSLPPATVESLLNDYPYASIDLFVLEPIDPNAIRAVFVVRDDREGMFSLENETGYQSSWFSLRKKFAQPDLLYSAPISGPGSEERQGWVEGAQAAFPSAGVTYYDFNEFRLTRLGDLQIGLGGHFHTLKRVWLPLIPGSYCTDPSTYGDFSTDWAVKMQYNVYVNGTVAVKLGCQHGADPGFKYFLLVGMGIGKRYELSPMDGGDTLEELVEALNAACPTLPKDRFLAENYKTVGFTSRELIYVTGNFLFDSLSPRYGCSSSSRILLPVEVYPVLKWDIALTTL